MKSSEKVNLEKLLHNLQYLSRAQRGIIKKAYLLAEDAHKFQKRLSGEPYIIHPLSVAFTLSELRLDHEAICAGLLHDVLEDTEIEETYIRKEFGESTANLVKAVTDISVIKNKNRAKVEAENLRRIILETVRDPRVILVKLADKLHNLRTLEYQSSLKARKIAREALDIYAPLAGRLGIYKIKSEIEDICLLYLQKKIYYKIRQMISEKKSTRDRRIKAIVSILSQKMKDAKIKGIIEGRSKHFFSIYQKMVEKNKNYQEIYDLTGIRILVDTISDCYKTLGVIHTSWSPVPGRFKDYVSVPKSNGYQSLHTTVIGSGGKPIEFQIRTREMHTICEIGIAAHWMYKAEKKNQLPRFVNIFQNIQELNADQQNSIGFLRDLKDTLLDDEIHAFTPKGEVVILPKAATVLDFAFEIHTELGIHCAGAEIASRFVSIRTQLKNGDQVNIITNPAILPAKRWMSIVKSSHAKSKLRTWFRKNQQIDGKAISETVLNKEQSSTMIPNDMILFAGQGKVFEHSYQFIRPECCNPMPDNEIGGIMEKEKKIIIHTKSCLDFRAFLKTSSGRELYIPVRWNEAAGPVTVEVSLSTNDDQNILMNLIRSISLGGAHILAMNMESFTSGKDNHDTFYQGVIQMECDHLRLLHDLMKTLDHLSMIQKINFRILQPPWGYLNGKNDFQTTYQMN
jgi:GTP pyrophosphokinase